jgi:hypothetical protein
MKQHWLARITALAVLVSLLVITAPGVNASSKGRRNTTIGLGAATAYSLLRGKTTQGLILGAGTAYAYSRYRKSRKAEKRRAQLARNSRYRTRYHRRYR